jgi:hypothetical protein
MSSRCMAAPLLWCVSNIFVGAGYPARWLRNGPEKRVSTTQKARVRVGVKREETSTLYIGETTLFVAAGHSMRKAVKMAVKKLGWSGKIDTVINRVRKKYREGVRR